MRTYYFVSSPALICPSFTAVMACTGTDRSIRSLYTVDQPAGTGYSYITKNDNARELVEIADQVVAFLSNFYQVFPEYATMDLFLAGESYSGMISFNPFQLLGYLRCYLPPSLRIQDNISLTSQTLFSRQLSSHLLHGSQGSLLAMVGSALVSSIRLISTSWSRRSIFGRGRKASRVSINL